jgi:aspartate 1-decarboxylase
MLRCYYHAKVHGLRVTDKSLDYTGSQGVPASVLAASGVEPGEQVHVLNKANGKRWVTYAIPCPEGECALNGAAARMGEVGDELILIAYGLSERPVTPTVVRCGPGNRLPGGGS